MQLLPILSSYRAQVVPVRQAYSLPAAAAWTHATKKPILSAMSIPWRFIPPNVVTCVSIVMGLLSVSHSVGGDFRAASWFIIWCMLLDKADGTVARLLKGTSRFGLELDSLADLVGFGVAPCVLVLSIFSTPESMAAAGLEGSTLFHWGVYAGSFLFVITSALRLAKYNVVTESYGKDFFFGLPTTSSGAVLATYFLTVVKYELPRELIMAMPVLMLVLALMMVSRLPIPKLGVSKHLVLNIFICTNAVLFYFFGILWWFPEYLLGMGLIYLIAGSGWALLKGVHPPPLSSEASPDGVS